MLQDYRLSKMQYSRKISTGEASKNAVMIEKSKLSMFPELGKEFKVKIGKNLVSAHVNSVSCTCTSPEKPHEHYFMHLFSSFQFKKAQSIKISKDSKGNFELKASK